MGSASCAAQLGVGEKVVLILFQIFVNAKEKEKQKHGKEKSRCSNKNMERKIALQQQKHGKEKSRCSTTKHRHCPLLVH